MGNKVDWIRENLIDRINFVVQIISPFISSPSTRWTWRKLLQSIIMLSSENKPSFNGMVIASDEGREKMPSRQFAPTCYQNLRQLYSAQSPKNAPSSTILADGRLLSNCFQLVTSTLMIMEKPTLMMRVIEHDYTNYGLLVNSIRLVWDDEQCRKCWLSADLAGKALDGDWRQHWLNSPDWGVLPNQHTLARALTSRAPSRLLLNASNTRCELINSGRTFWWCWAAWCLVQ